MGEFVKIKFCAVLLMACAFPATSFAQSNFRMREPFAMPQRPNVRDEQWIVFVDNCGETRMHQPVVLRQTSITSWTLEGQVVADEPPLCFSVPAGPGSTINAVRIRRQDLMTPLIDIDIDIDGPAGLGYEGSVELLGVGETIPPSIDGVWHDPANPGQGLYLALSPAGFHTRVVAVWATYDRGEPLWLTGSALNDGQIPNTVRLTLYRTSGASFPGIGPSAPAVEPWGELDLEYLGCHRMKASWRATDRTAFPDGSTEFHQFTPDLSHECDVAALLRTVAQQLIIYEPTIIRLPDNP